MNRLPSFPILALSFASSLLIGCGEEDKGTNRPNCPDQNVLAAPAGSPSSHKARQVAGQKLDSLPGIRFASADSVSAWFGGKAIKLAFVLSKRLYLAEWDGGDRLLTDLTSGDEGFSGNAGNINSPLFSPDGKRLVYGGSLSAPAVSFMRQAVSGTAPAWRVPLDAVGGHPAFDPHFVTEDGKAWIWFATDPGPVTWSDRCSQMGGSTYKAEVLSDSSLGSVQVTGLPGSFKGGLSKDLRWAGTSYSPSALHDRDAGKTAVLAGAIQQCNPSMNPFPAGSRNADYMMILGFGGDMRTVSGTVTEAIHENLWIYGKDDRIVWQGKRPADPANKYQQWQKPEWSTHPRYATAVALHDYQGGTARKGDLYAVRLPDLADADADALAQAEGHLLLAEGVFTESSFSHLWVAP